MADLIDKLGSIKWKSIIHHGKITDYEISETGMVRNKISSKFLTPTKTGDGFHQVTLIIDGKRNEHPQPHPPPSRAGRLTQ